MNDARGNTKMCSVLFVDIVGYSKKTNSEQIALKQRFVTLWSQAISDVPPSDIMVVDAGDGAAMTSLVEPEDSIRVARKLQTLMEADTPNHTEPLTMRMGINFGPVQLSTDVHGNACVVGDAINIAQRIMSFADAGQIMISRSYFDVITPLSHKYAEMFCYLGKRADKHVRYHDVYGLGTSDQSASIGRVIDEGHAFTQDFETEKEPPSEPAATPAPAIPPAPESKGITATPSKTSVLASTTKGLWRTVKDILFFLVVFLLIGGLYELTVLGPSLKNPEEVKRELTQQIRQVKEMWSGVKAAAETIETPDSDTPPQTGTPEKASTPPARQKPKPTSTVVSPPAEEIAKPAGPPSDTPKTDAPPAQQ